MMTYTEANTWCTEQNGNLPIPISLEENNFLSDIGSTWLGLNMEDVGNFTYTNWACAGESCEPSGDGTRVQLIVGERWTHDWGHGGWNDQHDTGDSLVTCYLSIKGKI